jgi:diguanylate cyclase (GGDEF)-like protein
MRQPTLADPSEVASPVSVEAAFGRVRLLAGALVLARLWTASSLPHVQAVLLVAAFWSVNIVAFVAGRQEERDRVLLDVLQLLADTLVVLVVAFAQRERMSADSADWAVLVLPAIEGAIRFRVPGAVASWLVLAGGYWGANMAGTPTLPAATIAQRLTVVLLVALPVGYLANHLVDEISAHRRGRGQAEQRSALLRAAALGGWRTSRFDVDEIVGVIKTTAVDMGFADPDVFEMVELTGDSAPLLGARTVRGSDALCEIRPGDPRLGVAGAAHAGGRAAIAPPDSERGLPSDRDLGPATLLALQVPMVGDQLVFVTVAWPGEAAPPSAAVESLELFAAQAGASLHNAQVHRGLEELKDRLDYEASHDALTELVNRRRFTDELVRTARRGRPGDLVAVLFIDLDGFKDVNDRFGHDAGNELLIAVAGRLRTCIRPGDLVARIGGDEFTIMLTRLENVAPAAAIAERVCRELSDPFPLGPGVVRISTSVGIALATTRGADTGDLLRRADRAMYRAKSNGKARWTMDPDSLDLAGELAGGRAGEAGPDR